LDPTDFFSPGFSARDFAETPPTGVFSLAAAATTVLADCCTDEFAGRGDSA